MVLKESTPPACHSLEQGDDRFINQGTFDPQGSNLVTVVNVVHVGDEPSVVNHVKSHVSDNFLL
jgi:hypothetical protein